MALAAPQMLHGRDTAEAADAHRVLLIERDPAIGQSLELLLSGAGFAVDLTTQATDGVTSARTGDYDIVLLGPNPPALEGGDLRASLRLGRIDAPFRFLSVSVSADGGSAMQINPCS